MKRKAGWMMLLVAGVMIFSCGCEDNDDGGSGASGSYAGTWEGRVCGRGLTMVIQQNGNTLTGSYTFTDPTFNGTFSGTVSSPTPPATARLDCAGHNWWFELTFSSYQSLSGGFYKAEKGGFVCSVSATK